MKGIRDYVRYYISDKDSEDFALWAFGENYTSLSGFMEFLNAWNSIHETQFNTLGDVFDDVGKMVNEWKKQVNWEDI